LPSLAVVSELLLETQGFPLLQLLSEKLDRSQAAREDPDLARAAEALGLLTPSTAGTALTDLGYILANVAKEYCHWVAQGRSMPSPRPPPALIHSKDVVDIGCGIGRWLWEFQTTARSVRGVELKPEYIEMGRLLALREGLSPPEIIQGSAEHIDRLLEPSSADLVFSRLVLNHVPIATTLSKVAAILRPGGVLWAQVESFRFGLSQCVRGEPRLRSRLLHAFGLVNSLFCMSNHQLAVRTGGRHHDVHSTAYPSLSWWKRAVHRAHLIEWNVVQDDDTLVFFARKPHRPR